jgi:hypothetical protein
MPRLSDTTRAQRRQHILTSAWGCISRDGFHVTSMDDIIAATGMSSSGTGVALLGAATRTPAPTTTPAKQTTP